MKRQFLTALIAAAGLVCACGAWAQGPPAGASSSTAGGSGTGLPAGPTTPNSRAQFCTETPSGGVAPANCTWGLAGDSPTDRGSGEASYTIAVTDIGTTIRETNLAGEAFTIPDGNTSGFVLPVNIGFIIEGGNSTITRTTSSQFRCAPNGPLVNTCTLSLGYQYILKETSDFNYTLSVSGDPGDLSANIYLRDEFVSGAPNTDVQIGELRWHLVAGAGSSGAALAGVYPHVGIEQLNSGTTASTRFHIQLANGANVFGALGGNTGWTATFIFKLEQTTNNRTFIGFTDSQDGVSAAIANGFYLRYDTNAGNADAAFKVVACSSSTCTVGATTYAVNTNWHRLVITCLVSGQITFIFDNNAAQTITTNVPTATAELPIFTEGNDTTASNSAMDVDFWGFSAQGVTRFP
jgi:hypothetical protein